MVHPLSTPGYRKLLALQRRIHEFTLESYADEGLVQLTVPNAPDASFFTVPLPYLSTLVVESGSDTQGFIENLAASSNLTGLWSLDFTESTELHSTWAGVR